MFMIGPLAKYELAASKNAGSVLSQEECEGILVLI